jgi:hypothetical protein
MKISLLLLIVAICFSGTASSQTPKYFVTAYPTQNGFFLFGAGTGPGANGGLKWQSIYYPSDFPNVPSGQVTHIYLRVGRQAAGGSTTVYSNFTVKMGYATKGVFVNSGRDSFLTGLTKVFDQASFTIPGGDTLGKWIKIPLNLGNFIYDSTKKFVVEVAEGLPVPQNPIGLMASTPLNNRSKSANRDSVASTTSFSSVMDFGFDLFSVGVDDLTDLTNVDLTPNPSDGRVKITIDAFKPLINLKIAVRNIAGQIVYQQTYKYSGKQISEQIDLDSQPKGMYFVELNADGQKCVKKVLLK